MATTAADNLSLLRCQIGPETYGIETRFVRSIERGDRIRWNETGEVPIGQLPDEDGSIPVFSLAELLGRPSSARSDQAVALVLQDAPPRAILVDHVSQVTRVPDHQRGPLPSALVSRQNSYVDGVIHLPGESLLLLSPSKLFDTEVNEEDSQPLPSQTETLKPDLHTIQPSPVALNQGRLILFNALTQPGRGRPITCGLSIAQVLEIMEPPSTIPVPSTPRFVLGLAPWGDHSVPIVDLAGCLGLPPETNPARARLLVASASSTDRLAFPVQAGTRILHLPVPHQVSTRDLGLNTEVILGAFELRNETLVLLDLAAILDLAR
jgi:chemotaxis signal transduction protein